MESILAIVFIFGGGTLFLLAVSPVGRAIADRIRHRGQAPPLDEDAQAAIVEQLQQLRAEVAELAERVDFTERMLAKARQAEPLGPPR